MNGDKTLLSILTGGKYSKASDLPTLKDFGNSAINKLIEADNKRKSKVIAPAGKNIFGQPIDELTIGDLENLVGLPTPTAMGTTIPMMKKLGLTRNIPKNPLFHLTDLRDMSGILGSVQKGGVRAIGKDRVSFTRDPMMREVPGLGDREIQLVLDKDKILKFSKGKLKPYQFYYQRGKDASKGIFEAEESLSDVLAAKKGTGRSAIKALKILNLSERKGKPESMYKRFPSLFESVSDAKRALREDQADMLDLLIKDASYLNIPILASANRQAAITKLLEPYVGTDRVANILKGLKGSEIIEGRYPRGYRFGFGYSK
jgi:hypothetical protein